MRSTQTNARWTAASICGLLASWLLLTLTLALAVHSEGGHGPEGEGSTEKGRILHISEVNAEA